MATGNLIGWRLFMSFNTTQRRLRSLNQYNMFVWGKIPKAREATSSDAPRGLKDARGSGARKGFPAKG